MGRWGSADFKELIKLRDKLKHVQKVDYNKFCEKQLKKLAQRFLRRVIKRTSVVSGDLKRGWTVGEVTRKGNDFVIEIINKKMYASYYEFGHRQLIGRFVPAIGKRLVKGWVEGKFSMTITEKEIERDAPKILNREFEKFIGEIFNGK